MSAQQSIVIIPPLPGSLGALTAGERLLVLGLRRWIAGWQRREPGHWSLAWKDFTKALGRDSARQALAGVNGLIWELATSIRRPYRHAPCCCPVLCSDEMAVLCLVAACQKADFACSARLAEWLVKPRGADRLVATSSEIASALVQAGYALPDRQRATDRTGAVGFAPALHLAWG